MIGEKALSIKELLRMSERAIDRYCYRRNIPSIPASLAPSGFLGEKDFAVFHIPTISIMLSPTAPKFLSRHTYYNRTWWLNYYIYHELTHYEQFLKLRKTKNHITRDQFDEWEAIREGQLYADRTMKTYSEEVINPILPEIGSGIVAGVGLGVGFKLIDHFYSKHVKKNLANPVGIDGWKFPVVDIGQLSPDIRKELSSLVNKGKVIKYTDYTFPMTKTGYILASHKISPEKQAKKESLRSLQEGSWKWHPHFKQIERKMVEEVKKNPELYSSPSRAVKDELEQLFQTGDKKYYLLKAAIKTEIRDRKARKKAKNFKELTLPELESCLGFANRLYKGGKL